MPGTSEDTSSTIHHLTWVAIHNRCFLSARVLITGHVQLAVFSTPVWSIEKDHELSRFDKERAAASHDVLPIVLTGFVDSLGALKLLVLLRSTRATNRVTTQSDAAIATRSEGGAKL